MSSPPDSATLWQVAVTVPAAAAPAFVASLAETALSVSDFAAGDGTDRTVTALYAERPDPRRLPDGARIEPLKERDWIAESQRLNVPLAAGRFIIRGGHHGPSERPGDIDIVIEAGRAFGSGHHHSTLGCLLALDGLAKIRRFRRVLDLGTGSGILAIAAAKRWRVPVLAADVDPVAAAIARRNATRNGVGGLVRVRRVKGAGARWARLAGPFDLIVANILARPLAAMARELAGAAAADGIVVLSGLLVSQERMVASRYRGHGLRLAGRIAREGWLTLVLATRQASAMRSLFALCDRPPAP